MSSKKTNFQKLVDEALSNAQGDRGRILDAYEYMRAALEINPKDDEERSTNMLVGGNAVKLLEQATRANEQIVKLAQIKERQENKENESNAKKGLTLDDIKAEGERTGISSEVEEEVKLRVEEENESN